MRVEPWLQAGKYVAAVASGMAERNGWTIAEQAGDRGPERMQRLLSRAVWDTFAAMGVVRRFAVAGLDEAARRGGRRRGLRIGAIDETSQVKQGGMTAGVKRHYLGCVGKVANGITTVHLAYARERTGHALIGARQWIPAEQIDDPVTSLVMGLPDDLQFRTKGQLAIDICTEAFADGVTLDFVCGDEVYGSCTKLREFLEGRHQAYVLRVPCSFPLTLARGITRTCADAATGLCKDPRRWEVRSAGLRWPVKEDFAFGKDCFGLDQSRPATPSAGRTGGAATKPSPAGTTCAPGSPTTPQLPWSVREWLLPY